MRRSRLSVPGAINTALIAVTTSVLVTFGVFDYLEQHRQRYQELNASLGFTADQLSSSLALPLWNFQNEQAVKIVENAMRDRNVVAVLATENISRRVIAGRARNDAGQVVEADRIASPDDLLTATKPITFNSREIGEVEVWLTPRHVRQAMNDTLMRLVVNIMAVNVALVALLYFILSRSIVRPLRSVETYALAVSAEENSERAPPEEFKLLELENLRNSIVVMVDKLHARYEELARSERGLAEAEKRYRSLYENALAGIFQALPGGRIIAANAAMAGILGYSSPESLLLDNASGSRIVDPAEQEALRALLREKGEVSKHSIRFKRADGDVRVGMMHARLVRGQDGQSQHIDGIFEDITEQTRAQRQLREAHSFIQNILDSMPSMMIGIDQDGRITQVNKPAEQASGLAHGAIIGRMLTDVFGRLGAHMESVRRSLKGGRPVSLSGQPYIKDGQPRLENILVFPVISEDKSGAVIRIDDVTDQARMEKLIMQTEKMMSLGGLAAGMAHEINNPLAGILQGAQNIMRRVSPELEANARVARETGCDLVSMHRYLERREVLDFLRGIKDSGERAAKIVNNMLSFTRRASAQTTPTHLDELLDRSVELASTDYDLKKKYDFKLIEIIREYEADVPPVPCAPMEIEQVVINLLRNAAQAMSMNPREGAAPRIFIRLKDLGESALIEIEDNGPGIGEQDRQKIFEPFFTTKKPGEGTGLGLSVSYFIITRNHGGTIRVESPPGRGARFIITLPHQSAYQQPAA
jgi:PAS domain S-box-containing protein